MLEAPVRRKIIMKRKQAPKKVFSAFRSNAIRQLKTATTPLQIHPGRSTITRPHGGQGGVGSPENRVRRAFKDFKVLGVDHDINFILKRVTKPAMYIRPDFFPGMPLHDTGAICYLTTDGKCCVYIPMQRDTDLSKFSKLNRALENLPKERQQLCRVWFAPNLAPHFGTQDCEFSFTNLVVPPRQGGGSSSNTFSVVRHRDTVADIVIEFPAPATRFVSLISKKQTTPPSHVPVYRSNRFKFPCVTKGTRVITPHTFCDMLQISPDLVDPERICNKEIPWVWLQCGVDADGHLFVYIAHRPEDREHLHRFMHRFVDEVEEDKLPFVAEIHTQDEKLTDGVDRLHRRALIMRFAVSEPQ